MTPQELELGNKQLKARLKKSESENATLKIRLASLEREFEKFAEQYRRFFIGKQ